MPLSDLISMYFRGTSLVAVFPMDWIRRSRCLGIGCGAPLKKLMKYSNELTSFQTGLERKQDAYKPGDIHSRVLGKFGGGAWAFVV